MAKRPYLHIEIIPDDKSEEIKNPVRRPVNQIFHNKIFVMGRKLATGARANIL